jgi:sigma-E factor negative regulatory protein RseA
MVNTLGGSAVRTSYSSQSAAQQLVDYDQLARQRLQRYILPHAEQAALNAPQGMMPYARVASFQTEE